jgi:PhnB protein
MPANPPENMPRITPYLLYEDVGASLDWLSRTFGLSERMRMPGPDGKIMHAEMEYADGVVMMGNPGPDYQSPASIGHVTQQLYIYVDDVDKHFQHARDAGATIIAEPEDQFYGDRRYGVEDLEGHHWYFAQHVRDVDPADYPTHP